MILKKFRGFVVRFVTLALISASFAQVSFGGVVGTDYVVEADARTASLVRVSTFLARADVAQQLQNLGVDPSAIDARLAGLTNEELIMLEGRIDQQIAGGGELFTLVGAVFLVLLILELVGVTDIFKSF